VALPLPRLCPPLHHLHQSTSRSITGHPTPTNIILHRPIAQPASRAIHLEQGAGGQGAGITAYRASSAGCSKRTRRSVQRPQSPPGSPRRSNSRDHAITPAVTPHCIAVGPEVARWGQPGEPCLCHPQLHSGVTPPIHTSIHTRTHARLHTDGDRDRDRDREQRQGIQDTRHTRYRQHMVNKTHTHTHAHTHTHTHTHPFTHLGGDVLLSSRGQDVGGRTTTDTNRSRCPLLLHNWSLGVDARAITPSKQCFVDVGLQAHTREERQGR
jgi:hypothetical protein